MLKDFFNDSQELLINSFTVQKVTIDQNGEEIATDDIPTTDYTVTPTSAEGKNGFELQFEKDINSAYKIVYKTKATNRVYDKETIVNEVTTGGKTITGTEDIDQRILFKSNQNANYKDKTVDWTITFNHDRKEMKKSY